MTLYQSIIILAAGFLLILQGTRRLVDSAVRIAQGLHLPKVLIGTTLVSLATIAPEFFVSATAALQGKTALAVGNAVGSPINNIGLIFSLCVLFTFIPVSGRVLFKEGLWMAGTVLIFFLLSLRGVIDRPAALLLLILTCLYLHYSYGQGKNARQDWHNHNPGLVEAPFALKREVFLFLLGAGLIAVSSRLLILSGTSLARHLGVSQSVIGLTIVALGSSLPEFFTSLTALARKEKELSAGNIIGANILNLTLVVGAAGTLRPLPVDRQVTFYALPFLLLLSLLFILFGHTRRGFQRWEGALLLMAFAAYLWFLF